MKTQPSQDISRPLVVLVTVHFGCYQTAISVSHWFCLRHQVAPSPVNRPLHLNYGIPYSYGAVRGFFESSRWNIERLDQQHNFPDHGRCGESWLRFPKIQSSTRPEIEPGTWLAVRDLTKCAKPWTHAHKLCIQSKATLRPLINLNCDSILEKSRQFRCPYEYMKTEFSKVTLWRDFQKTYHSKAKTEGKSCVFKGHGFLMGVQSKRIEVVPPSTAGNDPI